MRKLFGYFSEAATLGIVAFILIVGPLNFGSRALTAQGWIHIASAFLLLFWMIRMLCLVEPTFIKTSITVPLLTFLGYLVLRYLFCDVKWTARQEVLMLGSYAILFFAIVNNLQRRWQVQAILCLILLIGAAEAADGVVRYYRGGVNEACRFFFWECSPRFGFQNQSRAGGTFWTPDHFAAYLIMGFLLAASHIVVLKRSWATKVLFLYLGGCILTGVALSKSRGGWLSLVCTVGFFVYLVIRGKFLDFRSALVALVVLAGVSYYLYTKYPLVAERMEDLLEQGEATREMMYTTAVKMTRDHPIFGVGPQMYDTHFWRYKYNASNPEFVHSEFLQVFADLGIVGAALAGWVLVTFFRTALRMGAPKDSEYTPYVSSEVAKRLAFVIGGTAAVFAFTVHGIFDFVWHVMGLGVTITTIVALIYASSAFRRKRSETDFECFGFDQAQEHAALSPAVQRYALVALGVGFLLFLFVSYNNHLSLSYCEKGFTVAHKEASESEEMTEHRNEAIAFYEKSLHFDPRNFTTALWLGTVYWEKTDGNYDLNATMQEYIRQALHWHDEAIRINPYFLDAYLNRANLFLNTGQPELARKDCEKLITLSPFNPVYRLLYGKVCLTLVDWKCAREQLTKARVMGEGSVVVYEAQRYLDLIEKPPLPAPELE